jgi:hypothetical protein
MPVHYFSRISKIDLMRVTHPHNLDAEADLQGLFDPFFGTGTPELLAVEAVRGSEVHQLVEAAVAARRQEGTEGELWFAIEEGFKRGKALYLLSSEELVRLKWAFEGQGGKQGTPQFHEILSALLRGDLPTMSS